VAGAFAEPSALAVTIAAAMTALATGLGAVPLAFAKRPSVRWLAAGNATAAALMLTASITLLFEGSRSSFPKTLAGGAAGIAAIALSARFVEKRSTWRFEELRGASARTALIIVAVMTVHSVAEGVGVGVAFGDGEAIGLLTTLAIALHNIPEGLAISLVLVPRGVSVLHAAGWSIVSSLPQPLLALPAFLFVEVFRTALPIGLGFAAGAMVWMVLARMVPDTLRLRAAGGKGLAFH
jgi:ZIP family zinc transporter